MAIPIVISIFLVVFVIHSTTGREQSPTDSRWAIYTAISIINDHNTDLDEYRTIVRFNQNYAIYKNNGHIYSIYPVGAPILAVPVLLPVIFVLDHTGTSPLWFTKSSLALKMQIPAGLEVLVASFFVALASVFIYLIGRFFLDRKLAMLLTFVFAFCTAAWSTASRALWQHGPSMLMLGITLYLILCARAKPRLIQYASLPLAFSYVVRPTNAISVALLTIYVFIVYREYFLRFLMWAIPVALPFLAFNIAVYGSPLSPYYLNSQTGSSVAVFLEALCGNLISPDRGIFIFSPILLLSIVGIVIKTRRKKVDTLDYFIVAIIILHWLLISTTYDWWGGYSFGPRFFSDMLPYFLYLLIPVLVFIPGSRLWKWVLSSGIVILITASFLINMVGATSISSNDWNTSPDIDTHPDRVWDWHDLQFMRWRQ